jgi:hypothetical protein
MFPRKTITQEVLRRLPEQDRPSLIVAMSTWWRDVRNSHSGMRLTEQGHDSFQAAGFPYYSFDAPDVFYPGRLLLLNQKLNCAYYVRSKHNKTQLTLYGEEMAMICALYNDWPKFCKYLERL